MSDAVEVLDDIDDHYAEHLAEVNESKEVISNDDIVNNNGILLCKKGMRINKKTAERLIQHKLTRPIEESITLSDSLDNLFLYNKLLSLLEKHSDLKCIHEQLKFSDTCKAIFTLTKLPPIVIQKLTVMQEQMPEQIDKAVFCAWLSVLITMQMGSNKAVLAEAYLAGLLHDIGFIHLSPDILRKKGALSAADWRAIQSHVVIGKLMLEKHSVIPDDVISAVLEHHERCDGSGYPVSKNDTTLGILGQVVGLADSIYSIRIHQFEKHGRNMFNLLPYLQLNAHTYFYDVYKTLNSILKQSGLKPALPDTRNISGWAGQLLVRGEALREAIDSLDKNNVLGLTLELTGNKGQSLYKVTHNVLNMMTQSGLVRDEMNQWLSQLIKKPDAGAIVELNEIELMMNELSWQLNNACRSCNSFLDIANAPAKVMFNLRESYNTLVLCLGDLEDKTR